MSDDPLSEEDVENLFNRVGMRSFEVFFEVVESGGFSRAAEKINLSQPTVSQHVQNLEEALRDTLILREDPGISLTPLGQVCYDKLKSMNAAKEDLKEELKRYFVAGQRNLHIAASTIPGEFILPACLPNFLDRQPDVQVELEIRDSQFILEQLDDGELRWGLTGTREENPSLDYVPLLVDEMILVGAPGRCPGNEAIDFEDFRELRYVGRSRYSGTQRAVETTFREAGHDPDALLDPLVRLGTVQSVREAVLNGLGVSFLPLCAVNRDLETGRLRRIATAFPTIERTFYGVKNRFIGVPPVVEDFESFLLELDHGVRSRA